MAITVTPLVGVWIEIKEEIDNEDAWHVTPLVGVWIEILFK
mgnify:CR=1 FL=1